MHTIIMHSYFVLLLDLLEIQDTAPYLALAKAIEDAPANAKIRFAHRANFILKAYLDLLKGEIAPEEFILLGDVESAVPLWQEGQETSEQLIKNLLNWEFPAEDVLILDEASWQLMLNPEQRAELQSSLTSKGKTLILG